MEPKFNPAVTKFDDVVSCKTGDEPSKTVELCIRFSVAIFYLLKYRPLKNFPSLPPTHKKKKDKLCEKVNI